MKYTKRPRTTTKHIELLKRKGVLFRFEEDAYEKLKYIGYYRLKPYIKFYQATDSTFKPQTDFDDVIQLYAFDRELKIRLFYSIERIEIAFRAVMVEILSNEYGGYWYLDKNLFIPQKFEVHQNKIQKRINKEKNKAPALKYFFKKYTEETFPPAWICIEHMTFGELLNIYEALLRPERKKIAQEFGLDESILTSWMKGLVDIRNICAHHSRLWNKNIKTPKSMKSQPNFVHSLTNPIQTPVLTLNRKIYDYLRIIEYFLLIISPRSQWKTRFNKLLEKYPKISLVSMGFPNNTNKLS